MFNYFSSETELIIKDIYEKNTEESHSRFGAHLNSKTSRIPDALNFILKYSKSEILRKKRFKTTKRLISIIINDFSTILHTFDRIIVQMMITYLDYLSDDMFYDFNELFEEFIEKMSGKSYKNENAFLELFTKLCTKPTNLTKPLLYTLLTLKEQFYYNFDTKFDVFFREIFSFIDGEESIHFLRRMIGNLNEINEFMMYKTMIHYGSMSKIDYVKEVKKTQKFIMIEAINSVVYDFLKNIPVNLRGNKYFTVMEKDNYPYRNIIELIRWGNSILDQIGAISDNIELKICSFMILLGGFSTSLPEKRVNIETPEIFIGYFKNFFRRSNSQIYRVVLRNIFREDLGKNTNVVYSRQSQRTLLEIIGDDKRVFYDEKLFLLLLDIFNLVECFRADALSILDRFIDVIYTKNLRFANAFDCRLRILLFMTKSQHLQFFSQKCLKRREISDFVVAETGKSRLEYSIIDISEDLKTYDEFLQNTNEAYYGATLKSSFILENNQVSRDPKVKYFR